MIKKLILLHKILIFVLVFSIAGCTKNKHEIDTSKTKLEVKTYRFEQKLFKCKSVKDILLLQKTEPNFYEIYVNNIMPRQISGLTSNKQDIAVELYKYIAHPNMDSLYKLTQEKFGNFKSFEGEIENVNKLIYHYFPDEKIEDLITFVSTFEYGSIYNESDKAFGIGLEMYMGRNFEIYSQLNPQNFPRYRQLKFEPYHIVPNCVKSFLNYKIPEANTSTFLDQAVYEGKKLYAMDLILPAYPDSLKIGYLNGQTEWNKANEKQIWAYLIEKDVLFSSDKSAYQQHFFNDGPFTTPFGNDSSPRAGAWLGWQIVRSYMKKNPGLTLSDLLFNKNHNQIFQKSGYRP